MSHANTNTRSNKYIFTTPRHGNKWSIPECLRLHREFDLLHLSMHEIANLHGRTVNAIMCKIQAEGWASYNDLYVQTYGQHTEENDLQLKSDLHSDDDSDAEESDEEFVPNVLSDSESDNELIYEDDDDGSNYEFIYQRIKSMQQQINTLMGYFTKKNEGTNITMTMGV